VIRALCAALVLAACANTAGPAAPAADPAPAKPAAGPVQALPPIELTCADDRDCALADVHLDGPDTCCAGCNMAYAARADWLPRLKAACAARADLTAHCLPLNCPVGAERAVCRDHRCTVSF